MESPLPAQYTTKNVSKSYENRKQHQYTIHDETSIVDHFVTYIWNE